MDRYRYALIAITLATAASTSIEESAAQSFDAPVYGPALFAEKDATAAPKPRVEALPPAPRVTPAHTLIYEREARLAAARRGRIAARKAAGVSIARPTIVGRPIPDPYWLTGYGYRPWWVAIPVPVAPY